MTSPDYSGVPLNDSYVSPGGWGLTSIVIRMIGQPDSLCGSSPRVSEIPFFSMLFEYGVHVNAEFCPNGATHGFSVPLKK